MDAINDIYDNDLLGVGPGCMEFPDWRSYPLGHDNILPSTIGCWYIIYYAVKTHKYTVIIHCNTLIIVV